MYELMESKRALTEEVRRFVQEMVVDKVKEIEETDEFPWHMAEHFFKRGYLTLLISKKYGGFGGSIMDFCTVVEEIAKYSASLALLVIVQTVGTLPILLYGTEKQKKYFLEDIAHNHRLIGFALTEPKAGSDAGSIQLSAKNHGRHHILNGKKTFVTNGGVSYYYSTFAKTNPRRGKRGLTTFVVPADADGLIVGKKDDKIGMRGIPSTSLSFKDVSVSNDNIIGKKGEGFRIAMETLNRSRPAIAAQAVGIAEAAMEFAILFAMKRRQFGKPIAKLEGMQFILADMAASVEAARNLVYKAAYYIDHNHKSATKLSAMSKFFCSDMAMKVTIDAVQVFGGYGCLKSRPLERMMRDAKITQIYEGTNQIQRFVVAEQMIKEHLETYDRYFRKELEEMEWE